MYSPTMIAEYIIQKYAEQKMPITNLKLQALLYLVQCRFIEVTGEPCFREQIEAWDIGPIVKPVYKRYKSNGAKPLVCYSYRNHWWIPDEALKEVDATIRTFGRYSQAELVSIIKKQDIWKSAYRPENGICIITIDNIKEYIGVMHDKR